MNILVLGASGMIGSEMFRVLASHADWNVSGSMRRAQFDNPPSGKVFYGVDLAHQDQVLKLFDEAKPDVVVNCVGLTKHLPEGNEPIPAITMNALLPHRLAAICSAGGARLIHVSTDCVFSGRTGNYLESTAPDADDVYGKTKHLGEVAGENLITLRTSTIGHEHGTRLGLLEWFLAQRECKGYRRAVFSGLPTVEFARVVRDFVIPNPRLSGLYHVGADPIDKYTLLQLIAKSYGKDTRIVLDDEVVIDRSLNSELFTAATGYRAAEWPALIEYMFENRIESRE